MSDSRSGVAQHRVVAGLSGVVLRSERFVIGVDEDDLHRNVFQVQFSAGDGSVFVHFPYFEHTTGIVCLATLAPGSPATLQLEVGGKVSSHLVKYSHHPDGTALFSQDGRVLSRIRKQCLPLRELNTHLFTIHAKGLRSFAMATAKDDPPRISNKRTRLSFAFGSETPISLKFVGRLLTVDAFAEMVPSGVVEARMPLRSPDGTTVWAFVCSSPEGSSAHDMILLLSCESLPHLDQDRDSFLLFLGGFDAPEIASDPTKQTTVLAFSYPVLNADELRQRLGSIDFSPST